jgi:DNA repair protein RadC
VVFYNNEVYKPFILNSLKIYFSLLLIKAKIIMYTPINQWAEDDRPREKLLLKGKSALSDSELLAILIGSGSRNESAVQLCQRILASVNNNLNLLGKLSIQQLTQFKGIGEAKAIAIIAALELGRRRRIEETNELDKITSSKAVFEIMQPIIGELAHEEFWVLYLNNSNKVIHKAQLSKGGITGTIVDSRIIFKTALEYNATSLILTHNHPSGKLLASEADKEVTKKLKLAGQQMDILVLDHIIITETGYYSFNDEGIF